MGQILGLGITHYPGLAFQGNLSRRIKMCLADPALPEIFRAPDNWPAPMREQWGADDGQAHSAAHRGAMIEGNRPILASGASRVWIIDSTLTGAPVALKATGAAQVMITGSKVHGKIEKAGAARVVGRN